MIIPPARPNGGRNRVSNTLTVPAPVGGWNARDALDGMKPTDAVQLDNYIPGTDNVRLRRGTTTFSGGMGGGATVRSIMPFASGATERLLAASNGIIYDCSTEGTLDGTLGTGFGNDDWQHEMMSGNALLFNGEDSPQKYDGSTLSSNTITGSGLTSSNLIYPWAFKQRVFIIEKNSLNAWYLGTSAISGSASKLDFSAYCSLGGALIAGGTWTRDGGEGIDDLCVFITDKGEVLVYQGTDPSSASTWALVGVFRIAPPVGSRPMLRIGPDLVVITLDGFISLSKLLPTGRAATPAMAISDKIRNAVNTATRATGGVFGWQAVHYPKGSYTLFNVPQSNGDFHQYVVNNLTGAWCRFTGIDAHCWAVYQDNLVCGTGSGSIYRADNGTSDLATLADLDGGNAIQGDIRPAFNHFGSRGRQKLFKLMRPVTVSEGSITYTYTFNRDYGDSIPAAVASANVSGPAWNETAWNTAEWGGGNSVQNTWLSIGGTGFCGAPIFAP